MESNGHTRSDREKKINNLYTMSGIWECSWSLFQMNVLLHCIVRCGFDDEIFVRRIKNTIQSLSLSFWLRLLHESFDLHLEIRFILPITHYACDPNVLRSCRISTASYIFMRITWKAYKKTQFVCSTNEKKKPPKIQWTKKI